MSKIIKIVQEQKKCIGCGSCVAVCPKYWQMAEDGKAELSGSVVNPKTGSSELEVEKAECNREAADSCPVQCITIIDRQEKNDESGTIGTGE